MTRIVVFLDFTKGICHIEAGSIIGSMLEEVSLGAELAKKLSDDLVNVAEKYGLSKIKSETVEHDITEERFPRANP